MQGLRASSAAGLVGLLVGGWCLCAVGGSAAQAGGLFVPGAGPTGQGRAGAFAAKADDPTAISYNAAGFAKLDGTQLYIGANYLRLALSFQREGSYEPTGTDPAQAYEGQAFPRVKNGDDNLIGIGGFQVLPALALSTDLGHSEWPLRFGIGLYSVQGSPSRSFESELRLPSGETAPAPQRYDVVSQEIVAAFPSILVAYSPRHDLDIGIRGTWGYAKMSGTKTVWTLRNYEESPAQDATFTLDGATDRFVPTVGVGALYRPHANVELALAWNSGASVRAKGEGSSVIGPGSPFGDMVQVVPRPDNEVECAKGGAPGALKACVSIDLAQNATLGGRYIFRDGSGSEKADIELDLRWEDWSAANTSIVQVDGIIDITGGRLNAVANPHGFQDVLSTRLGGSYHLRGLGGEFEVRAGMAYDTKTAPKSWTRADQDGKARATFATGLGFARGRYRFDLGLGGVWEPTITVANTCKPPFGPSDEDPGCDAQGMVAVGDRTAPDPAQPLFAGSAQKQSPFNAGIYKSSYVMFATGMRVAF